VTQVGIVDVRELDDENVALRMVVLADRMYDRDIPLLHSGVPLDRMFGADMLKGGYRKKYLRALSRLIALANTGLRQDVRHGHEEDQQEVRAGRPEQAGA
ncbi:MAG TPA: AFG1/ZapE family ATPase, partial [Kribbellaceae bacterium]